MLYFDVEPGEKVTKTTKMIRSPMIGMPRRWIQQGPALPFYYSIISSWLIRVCLFVCLDMFCRVVSVLWTLYILNIVRYRSTRFSLRRMDEWMNLVFLSQFVIIIFGSLMFSSNDVVSKKSDSWEDDDELVSGIEVGLWNNGFIKTKTEQYCTTTTYTLCACWSKNVRGWWTIISNLNRAITGYDHMY